MQSGPFSPTDRRLSSKHRSETRMPVVALPIPTGHRLGVEDIHSLEEKWNQWTPWTHLDDLDIADDLAVLSHAQ